MWLLSFLLPEDKMSVEVLKKTVKWEINTDINFPENMFLIQKTASHDI